MKIAVFVTGWNKEYLRYLYGGLVNAQNKFGDEIDIYTCFAKLGSGNSVDKSEFSFFKLANLKEYDGIIFPSTTVKEGNIKNKMIDWILASGRPCVTLEEMTPYMSSAGTSQWNGMQDMVEHLYRVHGIHTFGFLGGYTDTGEADLRKSATMDYIEKHGLNMLSQWVRDGIYECSDGMEYARDLLLAYEQQKEIPQAVVCANDVMAAGIIDGLTDTPLQEKIAVTGFDHYYDGELFSPTITSIRRPREEVAFDGIKLLHELVEKKHANPIHRDSPYKIVIGQTCGCKNARDAEDNTAFRKKMFMKVFQERQISAQLDSMEESVAGQVTLEQLLDKVADFLEKNGVQSIKIMLSGDLLSHKEHSYRSCNHVALDRQKGGKDSSRIRVLMPLHYQQHQMGYCKVVGMDKIFDNGLLEAFFRTTCYAMENYIQRQQYTIVNQKLQRLYRIDQLTGIYNRFGMEDLGQSFYHNNCAKKKDTVFIFCDINRLKYINDTYGHQVGDWVIQTTGKALAALESEESMAFRYGGDEFVLLTTECSGVDENLIREKLEEMCQDSPMNEKLEISIGKIIASWKDPEDMDTYLDRADEAMYQEKKQYYERNHIERRRQGDRN